MAGYIAVQQQQPVQKIGRVNGLLQPIRESQLEVRRREWTGGLSRPAFI